MRVSLNSHKIFSDLNAWKSSRWSSLAMKLNTCNAACVIFSPEACGPNWVNPKLIKDFNPPLKVCLWQQFITAKSKHWLQTPNCLKASRRWYWRFITCSEACEGNVPERDDLRSACNDRQRASSFSFWFVLVYNCFFRDVLCRTIDEIAYLEANSPSVDVLTINKKSTYPIYERKIGSFC